MTHPIYVCLECKITMHTCRNVGIHTTAHHNLYYPEAEKKGIVVKIDDCNPEYTCFGRCPSPRDKPATDFELKAAKRILERRRQ